MSTSNIEFRVGLVVLIGIILLVGSLYWLQGYQLEKNAQLIRVFFGDVGTLSAGDKVTVSGVHRGKVKALQLGDGGVIVDILLSSDVVLKKDARIVIKNLGLMGERFIAISPGVDPEPLDITKKINGFYDTGMHEVLGLMGEMMTDLRNLVVSFRRTVGSDTTLDKFNRTVNNLDRVSSSLADYMQRNQDKLDHTVDNFLEASRSLNQTLVSNASRVDSSLARFDRVSSNMERLTWQLDSLALSARAFADKIENEDGTLQLLLEDRRLYDDLRRTADNIDDLVSDIRENPSDYINLKIELF